MEGSVARVPERKSLFKRSAIKKSPAPSGTKPSARVTQDQAPDESDEDIQFFRRNQDSFTYFDDAGSEKDKAEKDKVEENAPAIVATANGEDRHGRKRRKVSLDHDDHSGSESGGFLKRPEQSEPPLKEQSPADDSDDSVIMDVKGKGKEIITPQRPREQRHPSTVTPAKRVISLDDDEDDKYEATSPLAQLNHDFSPRGAKSTPRSPRRASGSLYHSDIKNPFKIEDSDSEIEFIGETRANDTVDEDDLDDEFAREIEEARARARAKANPAAASGGSLAGNVPVHIMVDSPRIPDAVPLHVKRRIGQQLDIVLDTWVQLQATRGHPLPVEIRDKVFLTWRRNRIYRSASVSTLPGVEVDSEGNLKGNSLAEKNGGYYEGGLYFEVWTEDLLVEDEKERQRERQLSLGILDEDEIEDLEAPEPRVEKAKGIRVILKAKDSDPVKITVHPETTVDIMVCAFRQQRDVDESKEVVVFFDGDELEPDTRVEDLDVDPDETNQFEVHLK